MLPTRRNILHSSLSLAMLLLLTLPAVVQAQFSYAINNGTITITITGYAGPAGDVTIPNAIYVPWFGNLAVTTIGDNAFVGCRSLTSVTIPSSVISIGYEAFCYCTSLTAITVDTNNPAYRSVDGVLFDKSQTILIQCPGGKTGDCTIPDSVTSIGDGAFDGCHGLTSVTIPNSVTYIGFQAFGECNSLTTVAIPNSVTNIGNFAFIGCTSVTNVTIPNSVTSIGNCVFESCYSLPSVTIPNSVTSIGNEAFCYCTSLTNAAIPNSVISIGIRAFGWCSSLASVTIGNSVTNIGDAGFLACGRLSAITVDTNNPAYRSVDGVLFDKSQTALIEYPGAKAGSYSIPNGVTNIGNDAFAYSGLTSVTIPDSVTSIGFEAFGECISLTTVAIPNSVTNIGNLAFANCASLTDVYFQGNAPSLGGSDVFCNNNATVYYLPGTTGWGATFGGLPTVLWNPRVQTSNASFGVRSNRFGFNIVGTTDIPIVVEANTNLATGSWTPLRTCTLTNGSIYFSDPQWKNYPARFYRLRQ